MSRAAKDKTTGLGPGGEDGRVLVWILIPLMALFVAAAGLHIAGVTRPWERSLVMSLCRNDLLRPRLGKLCPPPPRRRPPAPEPELELEAAAAAADIQARILADLLDAQTATQRILTSENLTQELAAQAQQAWESLELALRSYREQGLPEEFMRTVGNLTQSIRRGQEQLEDSLETIEQLRRQLADKDARFDNLNESMEALSSVVASLARVEKGADLDERSFDEAARTLAAADAAFAANLLSRYKDHPEIITMLLLELNERERMPILEAMNDDLAFRVFDLMTTMAAPPAVAAPPQF